jgi:L-asparaginase II
VCQAKRVRDHGAMHTIRVVSERGGLVEAVHHVDFAIWRDGVVAGGDAVTFLRSAAKPVQALACLVTGAADRFEFTVPELSLACASHNGEPIHVETATRMLQKIGLDEGALLCGAHPPEFAASAAALIRAGVAPTAIHNNCSGKHAAMLAACVAAGWPIADYVAPEHPLQRLNRKHVALFAGVAESDIVIGIDGCSAPVFGMPLSGAARLIAAVATPHAVDLPADVTAAAERAAAAMTAAPEMVGGTRRSDTDLMRATQGRIVSKVGAEGLWSMGVRGASTGVAVKCRDGSSDAARRAGLALLRAMGLIDEHAWELLRPHHDNVRHNCRQLDVGRVRVEMPDGLKDHGS